LGDVNKMLPKPMDPVRMMYLPIACGVVLPPQLFYICFSKCFFPAPVTLLIQMTCVHHVCSWAGAADAAARRPHP
jgi:hypothetical protein